MPPTRIDVIEAATPHVCSYAEDFLGDHPAREEIIRAALEAVGDDVELFDQLGDEVVLGPGEHRAKEWALRYLAEACFDALPSLRPSADQLVVLLSEIAQACRRSSDDAKQIALMQLWKDVEDNRLIAWFGVNGSEIWLDCRAPVWEFITKIAGWVCWKVGHAEPKPPRRIDFVDPHDLPHTTVGSEEARVVMKLVREAFYGRFITHIREVTGGVYRPNPIPNRRPLAVVVPIAAPLFEAVLVHLFERNKAAPVQVQWRKYTEYTPPQTTEGAQQARESRTRAKVSYYIEKPGFLETLGLDDCRPEFRAIFDTDLRAPRRRRRRQRGT